MSDEPQRVTHGGRPLNAYILMCQPVSVIPHNLEPTTGLEPVTSSLPRKCSTTELCGREYLISPHTRLPTSNNPPVSSGAGERTRTAIISLEG